MQTLESQAFSERLLQGADIRKKPWSFAKSFGACLDYIRTILKSPKKNRFWLPRGIPGLCLDFFDCSDYDTWNGMRRSCCQHPVRV